MSSHTQENKISLNNKSLTNIGIQNNPINRNLEELTAEHYTSALSKGVVINKADLSGTQIKPHHRCS